MIDEQAKAITHAWMAHLGYTPEQITTAECGHSDQCEFTGEHWFCLDENLVSTHAGYDELITVSELVMFVLERVKAGPQVGGGPRPTDPQSATEETVSVPGSVAPNRLGRCGCITDQISASGPGGSVAYLDGRTVTHPDCPFHGTEAWKPGDPCGSCRSTDTYINDDGYAACRTCRSSDGDE